MCDAASLTACRGKLFSGDARVGEPVHAATFVRERRIVLDSELLARPRLLQLILLHEIFHLVWVRLGNRKRQEYGELLRRELRNRARGEIGESSGVQKERFLRGSATAASRGWREYACESFCDTAAWLYVGQSAQRGGGLAGRWRDRRQRWFRASFPEAHRC